MINRRKPSQEYEDNQAQEDETHLLATGSSYDYDIQISRSIPTTSEYRYPAGTYPTTPYSLPIPSQRKTRDKSPGTHNSNNNNNKLTQMRYVNNSHPYRRLESSNISSNKFQNESYELGTATGNSYSAGPSDYNVTIKQSPIDFIYYTVQPGDTLQNLSVKYSCPVASIKRLNNLWSDQEFYGLAKIKLPAGKLRLIADVINEENLKVTLSSQVIPAEASLVGLPSPLSTATGDIDQSIHQGDRLNDALYNPSIERFGTVESSSLETKIDSIFKDYDISIAKARTAARSYDNNACAILQSLAESGSIVDDQDDLNDPSKIARREAETLFNDMTDYGMSYSGLILFIFIVCLICPLAYVIYLEETHHDSNKAP